MAQKKRKPGRPPGSKNKTKKTVSSEAKEKVKALQEKEKANKKVIDEIWGVICIAIGLFIFLAVTFHAAGELGNTLGDFLKGIMGLIAMVFPWYLVVFGILLFAQKTIHISWKSALLVILILIMLCILNSARFIEDSNLVYTFGKFYDKGITLDGGGLIGMSVGTLFVKIIGRSGLYIFVIVTIIVCLLLVINTPISSGIVKIQDKSKERKLLKQMALEEGASQTEEPERHIEKPKPPIIDFDGSTYQNREKSHSSSRKKSNVIDFMSDEAPFDEPKKEKTETTFSGYGLDNSVDYGEGRGLDGAIPQDSQDTVPVVAAPIITEKESISKKEAAGLTLDPAEIKSTRQNSRYKKPPIDLLNRPQMKKNDGLEADLKAKAASLETTLQNFNVDASVVQVTQGPAVTRYEIKPAVGVKVNSIVRLADDIALNLRAKSIRIEAPIPGKAAVGIEVENDKINMVTLREIIESHEFKSAKSKITFAVGKDIAGKSIVADLKGMPHLLIAGSTGSGKSVCINSIITSILYKANPDEVKLVLVDPKVVELGNYNGIPHLLIPVVTEPTKAAAALNWAVAEMTDRYKKFAESGVRDLESYNEYVKANHENDLIMPQIVIIIDELADLMMAAPSQVEESICRLAQMARAAGMHLIVATQRPSVDIITGVIKANIPSRIAFAVSSQFDSRTILDMGGAEKLVGKGDMLFNPLGMGKPIRVQGTFISDSEVHHVIEYVKSQVEDVEYASEVIDTIDRGGNFDGEEDDADELLPDAIQFVVKGGHASVSMLQRRFRVGYNRAARIMDMMESRGIVGPQNGSKPRQVLVTEEELDGETPDETNRGEE